MKVGQSDKQRVLSTCSLYNAFNLALQSSSFFTYYHLAIQIKVNADKSFILLIWIVDNGCVSVDKEKETGCLGHFHVVKTKKNLLLKFLDTFQFYALLYLYSKKK